MELWIARDEIGLLAVYQKMPYKRYDTFTRKYHWCITSSSGNYMCLPDSLFPEVTFENSPQKVKLELIKE